MERSMSHVREYFVVKTLLLYDRRRVGGVLVRLVLLRDLLVVGTPEKISDSTHKGSSTMYSLATHSATHRTRRGRERSGLRGGLGSASHFD